MAVYMWKGRNRFGDVVEGERVASTPEDVARNLKREQITVMNIRKRKSEIRLPLPKRERVNLKDLAVYSRQLSVLIDSDLPLIQSLEILSRQTKNKYFSRAIKKVKEDVEAGSTLNEAKRKFPRVFDDLYCNLIASGEQSGSLDVVLKRLAEYIEKTVKLRSQVKQAMSYPVTIMGFAIIVAIFLMWKIVPTFTQLFVEMGATLPLLTLITVGLSKFIGKNIIFIFIAFVGSCFAYRYLNKNPQSRRVIDRIKLRLPLFGNLLKKVALTRITRTLSTLLSGGVPVLESLKISSSIAGNAIIEESIVRARTRVAEGKNFTDALREAKQFPFMLTQMVSVGEATGTLDEMLLKIADFYDDEVSSSVASLLALLEPILLIGVGGIIGSIVMSMYLPIFSIMQQF